MATKSIIVAKKTNGKAAAKAPAKKATTAPVKKTQVKAAAKPATRAAAKPATKAAAPAVKRAPRTAKTDNAASFFATFTPGTAEAVPAAAKRPARTTKADTPLADHTPAVTAPTAPEGTTPAAAPKTRASREDSAQARVIAMISTPEGATLDAIMKATRWQAHTVRGFISGTARKKLGLTIDSTRVDGQRTYRVVV